MATSTHRWRAQTDPPHHTSRGLASSSLGILHRRSSSTRPPTRSSLRPTATTLTTTTWASGLSTPKNLTRRKVSAKSLRNGLRVFTIFALLRLHPHGEEFDFSAFYRGSKH